MKDEKCLIPVLLVKKEKSHLLWFLYTVFFGLINIWAALLTGNYQSAVAFIGSGNFYTFSISICTPLCFNLLINFIKTKKSNKIEKVVTRKVTTILLNIIYSFVLCFLMLRKSILPFYIQIPLTIISVLFSFYMYALLEIDLFDKDYTDDKPYNEEEDESIKNNNMNITRIKKDGDVKL